MNLKPLHGHRIPALRRPPHIDRPGTLQFVTVRLVDSVPLEAIRGWEAALRSRRGDELAKSTLERLIERYGDRGFGECWLSRPDVARAVRDALFDGQPIRYVIPAWCIMPNHVHVVMSLASHVGVVDAVRDWKSRAARVANRILGRRGKFWMPSFFDRLVRHERHLAKAVEYIEWNPVEAGLVRRPEEWRWSSAHR